MTTTYKIVSANKKYICLSLILFLLGFIMGIVASEQLITVVEEQLDKIEGLAQDIAESGSAWYAFWVIFTNNIQAAVAFILLGSFFAIVPVLGLLVNGIIVGVVTEMVADSGVAVWQMLLIGLMPHGILELPAIFIAGAFAIKLGTVWILEPSSSNTRWQNYKNVWLEVARIAPMLLILLFVAAIIESFITPLLIHIFIGGM